MKLRLILLLWVFVGSFSYAKDFDLEEFRRISRSYWTLREMRSVIQVWVKGAVSNDTFDPDDEDANDFFLHESQFNDLLAAHLIAWMKDARIDSTLRPLFGQWSSRLTQKPFNVQEIEEEETWGNIALQQRAVCSEIYSTTQSLYEGYERRYRNYGDEFRRLAELDESELGVTETPFQMLLKEISDRIEELDELEDELTDNTEELEKSRDALLREIERRHGELATLRKRIAMLESPVLQLLEVVRGKFNVGASFVTLTGTDEIDFAGKRKAFGQLDLMLTEGHGLISQRVAPLMSANVRIVAKITGVERRGIPGRRFDRLRVVIHVKVEGIAGEASSPLSPPIFIGFREGQALDASGARNDIRLQLERLSPIAIERFKLIDGSADVLNIRRELVEGFCAAFIANKAIEDQSSGK